MQEIRLGRKEREKVMARKRMIDPEFWSDEEIGSWSFQARLFYIGLWNFADDEGRFKAAPKLLKAQIFPYDDKIAVNKLKKEVENKIQWYVVDSLQYGFIRNFLKHQRIDRPTSSKLPEPPTFDELPTSHQEHLDPNIREVNISKVNIKEDNICDAINNIINDFNSIFGTQYKPTAKDTTKLIKSRLNDGFTIDDFKKVHRKMLRSWGSDAKMVKYLRPITLYGTKFESYLNQKEHTTQLTEKGIKAYLVGQSWLAKQMKQEENNA